MKPKVLVIDDSHCIQLMVKNILRDENIGILLASTGADGIRIAHSDSPDLVLLDVGMPAPNGFEVCRQLKADATTSNIPIIFLTSSSSTADKVRGLNLGAVDYVTKPFDAAELCARVRASLRSKYMLDLLEQRAMIDGLTGLWNRAYLDQRLTSEVSFSQRHQYPFSVIMADVDKFKTINDQYGHPFGDEVLRRVAQILGRFCRAEDVVCRYGGEEFAILTPLIGLEGAATLAEHFRQAIRSEVFRYGKQEVHISCSFGVAELASDGGQDTLERADAALYRAKQNGRNRVIRADSTSGVSPAAILR